MLKDMFDTNSVAGQIIKSGEDKRVLDILHEADLILRSMVSETGDQRDVKRYKIFQQLKEQAIGESVLTESADPLTEMKTWIVTIKITGLTGERVMERTVKASNEKSARNKAYAIIGNQSGEIIGVSLKESVIYEAHGDLDGLMKKLKGFIGGTSVNGSLIGDEPVGSNGVRILFGAMDKRDAAKIMHALKSLGKQYGYIQATGAVPFKGSSFGGKTVKPGKDTGQKAYTVGMDYKGKNESVSEAADADVSAIIKELIDTNWGGNNQSQGRAVQLMKGLAFSDSPKANAFMKALDKVTNGMKIPGDQSESKLSIYNQKGHDGITKLELRKAGELLAELGESEAQKAQNLRVLKKLEGGSWVSQPGGSSGAFKVGKDDITWNRLKWDLEKVKVSGGDSKKGLDEIGQVIQIGDNPSDGSSKFKRVK